MEKKANDIFYANNVSFALDLKIFDGVGIYPLNYTNEEFVSGEYYCDENGIRYKDLYDNKLVSSLYHIDEAFVNGVGDVGEEPVKITGKKYKMQLLTSIGIDSSFYLQLNSATASYKEGKVIFDLAFEGGYNYSLTVRDFGTTSNRHYNEFMDEGGKMTQPSETLQEFRELMKMDNFRRYVYDFDAGGYTQTENFHQHYFYTQAIGSNDIYGYMSMNTKANEEHPDLKGCYYFYTSNGTPHFNSMAFNENPDIPMFFHYPKYMDLLNKLHFIVEGTSGDIKYEAGTKKYMVYDKTLIEDFAHNFSLDQAWDLGTCVPYGLGIETKIVEGSPDKSIINFHYLFKNKGDTYSYKIPMFDFGKVKVDGLDEIYDYYND